MTPARMVAKASEVDRFDLDFHGGVSCALVMVVMDLATSLRRAHPYVGPLHTEVANAGGAMLVMVQGIVPPTWTLRFLPFGMDLRELDAREAARS